MDRRHALVLMLVGLGGCVEDPGEPEPATSLGPPLRSWQVWRVPRDGLSDELIVDNRSDIGGELSVVHVFGPLGFYPQASDSMARAELFSSESGTTYWASTVAPNEVLAPGGPIGGAAELDQSQWLQKTSDNAYIRFVVTATALDVIDDNAFAPDPATCPWRSIRYAFEDQCSLVLRGSVSFSATVLRHWLTEEGEGVRWVWVSDRSGSVRLFGFRPRFYGEAHTAAWSSAPLWDDDAFEQDFGEGSAAMRLRFPITIEVPLDTFPMGAYFTSSAQVKVRTVNRRQGESYVAVYFRDPIESPGITLTYEGLQPIPRPPGAPTAPTRPDSCEASATPGSGTIQFDTTSSFVPELPGEEAWIVINRAGGSDGAVAARFVTHDGTATAGSDYEVVDQYVRFAAGESGARLARVPILADTLIEDGETVALELVEVPGCGVVGSPATATLTILDDDNPPVTPDYAVGGTVTGLVGTGLILRNLFEELTITADGPFAFGQEYPTGYSYTVEIVTQPSSPAQVCTVTNGTGTIADADITDVIVDCATPPPDDDQLDPTFGVGGKVTAGSMQGINDLAVQPDGKIVAVGQNVVARYNADGSLDPTFGTGGEAIVPFNDASDVLNGVALQSDGAIVVVGYTEEPGGTTEQDWAVARLTSLGALDPSFGAGGMVVTDFDTGTDQAWDVAILSDGSIVVGGHAIGIRNSFSANDFALARYTSAGALDTGFGIGGVVTTDIAGRTDLGYALALQPDGRLVLVGRVADSGGDDPDIGVVRYNADGSLDAGFGTGGVIRATTADVSDEASDVALQPDGRIVVSGFVKNVGLPFRFLVARYDAGGNPDPSFGGNGVVTDGFGTLGDQARGVALQADGKIVLAGETAPPGNGDFGIDRFNTDGTLDTAFGVEGRVMVDFFGALDQAKVVVVQPDGKILVGGLAHNGTQDGPGLIRLLP